MESALSFVDEADIVVLDLTLMDSEGAETVRRFKAGAPEDLPVVVYSALDEQALAEASQGIADASVVKGNVHELPAGARRPARASGEDVKRGVRSSSGYASSAC